MSVDLADFKRTAEEFAAFSTLVIFAERSKNFAGIARYHQKCGHLVHVAEISRNARLRSKTRNNFRNMWHFAQKIVQEGLGKPEKNVRTMQEYCHNILN